MIIADRYKEYLCRSSNIVSLEIGFLVNYLENTVDINGTVAKISLMRYHNTIVE